MTYHAHEQANKRGIPQQFCNQAEHDAKLMTTDTALCFRLRDMVIVFVIRHNDIITTFWRRATQSFDENELRVNQVIFA